MGKVDTGKMPEKIIAVAQYHSSLLTELHEKSSNKNSIIKSGLEIIGKHFGLYLDNLARRDHMSFHHVYETGETGNENARLFRYTISGSKITYNFSEATKQEKSGQVFKRKAFIMEDGKSLTIIPRAGKFLAFQVNGEQVFSKKVFVPNPGGTRVAGSFKSAFDSFMQNNANQVLTDIGFYDRINNEISKESDTAITKINNGDLNGSAMAKASAIRVARKAKN
ncbi:MAG: hypothetical protein EB127_17250 [Alphaproteobacteria bacterium]|nr:hypothetical protein [Alphaproteobacteria bacterium]